MLLDENFADVHGNVLHIRAQYRVVASLINLTHKSIMEKFFMVTQTHARVLLSIKTNVKTLIFKTL